MFATLVGSNIGATNHRELFDRLCGIATELGFAAPDASVPLQPDGSLAGWALEQKGPRGQSADFFLAVTAPRVPGISPLFPVLKTISGPLFAVVVIESAFVVSRADRRDVSELKDQNSVCASFTEFIDTLPQRQ